MVIDRDYKKIVKEYKTLLKKYPNCYYKYIITFIADLYEENITYIKNILKNEGLIK